MMKMTPVKTGKLTDDIFAVRDKFVNMYLVRDGEYFIAIDSGTRNGLIEDELRKLDIGRDKVEAVLLTHSDGDHAGGISLFDKAVIWLPKDEEQVINGKTTRKLWIRNKLERDDYRLIEVNDFMIGDVRIKMIPTPGHTPGSACYLINDKYLFTGDALRLYRNKIVPFPKIINKNARQARKSMNNIIGLDGVKYIFTGHYGYTSDYSSAIIRHTSQSTQL
jgi:hydroxyacylglutathione hydrolase